MRSSDLPYSGRPCAAAALFHLLELHVLGLAVVRCALLRAGIVLRLSGVGAGLCALGLLLRVDVLRSGLPCGVELRKGRVDGGYVGVLVRLLELGQRSLDGRLLVGRQLIAVLLELFLGREDVGIGRIDLVDALLLLAVFGFVGLGLVAHVLDLLLGQAA